MVKRKSPLEPSAGPRKRAYELPNMINVQVPQDPIRQIENQALSDLSNEYRTLRIEEMIAKKRRTMNVSESGSQKDTLEIFKAVSDFQKQNKPESADKTITLVKTIYDLVRGGEGNAPSFFDQYVKGRELGIFGQPSTGDSNKSDVEIEKLRGERMLNSKRIDLELTKLRLEQDAKRDTLGMVGQFLAPFVAFGGGKLAEDMQARGMRAGAGMHNPGNPSQGILPNSLQGPTAELHFKCTCGYDKVLVVPSPPPAQITCPGCGESLNTGPPPLGDLETSAQWRPQA